MWASLNDEKSLAFRYTNLGEMLTLGDFDASVSGPSALEGLIKLSGPVASAARRVVYAARMPTADQRIKSVAQLAQGPLRQAKDILVARSARTGADR